MLPANISTWSAWHKTPSLVVGDREAEAGAVSVRLRSGEDLKARAVEECLTMARQVVDHLK
jgi:hypothetical protein